MTTLVLTNVTQGVQALSTAIAAAGNLSTASLAALAPVAAIAQAANSLTDTAITSTDALIPTSGIYGIVGGGFAPTLIANLLAAQVALSNQIALMQIKGAVGRIAFNFSVNAG